MPPPYSSSPEPRKRPPASAEGTLKLARALFTAPTVLGLSASSPPRHVRADRGGVAGGLARADECSSMASRWCRKVPAGSSECRCDVESGQDWPLATGATLTLVW